MCRVCGAKPRGVPSSKYGEADGGRGEGGPRGDGDRRPFDQADSAELAEEIHSIRANQHPPAHRQRRSGQDREYVAIGGADSRLATRRFDAKAWGLAAFPSLFGTSRALFEWRRLTRGCICGRREERERAVESTCWIAMWMWRFRRCWRVLSTRRSIR